jgi:hypothetical protein
MQRHTGLLKSPLFAPCVRNFRRGTGHDPLHRDWLRPASVCEVLRERLVSVNTRGD